jgi:hypothetical protein
MLHRIRLAMIALLGIVLLAAAPAARADDKPWCAYCEAVKHVAASVHCDHDKAGAQCEKCAALSKRITDAATCHDCDEKTKKVCKECAEFKLEDGCKSCAEKKAVVDECYCCAKCDEADKTCPKCDEFRKEVMAIPCKECAAKKKA